MGPRLDLAAARDQQRTPFSGGLEARFVASGGNLLQAGFRSVIAHREAFIVDVFAVLDRVHHHVEAAPLRRDGGGVLRRSCLQPARHRAQHTGERVPSGEVARKGVEVRGQRGAAPESLTAHREDGLAVYAL